MTRAVEILQWGRELWEDIPKDDRGAIFELTFLRGLRSLRLEYLMKVSRIPIVLGL